MVRDHGTLVIGPLDPASEAVAERVAAERHATLVRAPAHDGVALRAPGGFQRRNFALAAGRRRGVPGPRRARPRRRPPPRRPRRRSRAGWRSSASDPLTVYDGAHNPAGARALAESLAEVFGDRRPRVAVIGVLEDKDAAGMLERAAAARRPRRASRAARTRARCRRARSSSLAEKLGGPPSEAVSDPRAAVARARELAGPGGAVLATGSIYLIADLVRADPDRRASTL